jgi:hypothetical protein
MSPYFLDPSLEAFANHEVRRHVRVSASVNATLMRGYSVPSPYPLTKPSVALKQELKGQEAVKKLAWVPIQ